jgi:hypothetical protein
VSAVREDDYDGDISVGDHDDDDGDDDNGGCHIGDDHDDDDSGDGDDNDDHDDDDDNDDDDDDDDNNNYYYYYLGSTVYSTGSVPVSSSVSSSTQRQSVPVVPSINTSNPSSLPSVPTTSSVSFDNKRHSTGSTSTTNPPAPALYPAAVSPTLSSSAVSSASDYDLMNNPMPASKATAAPSHRASMPVTSSVSASNPFGANPFGVSSTSNPFGEATTAPSTLSTASHLSVSTITDTNKRLSVRALYDHEAEEEDELNFKAGDAVEVVEKLEGGWWRGSCRGKEGLFPSNYVQNP